MFFLNANDCLPNHFYEMDWIIIELSNLRKLSYFHKLQQSFKSIQVKNCIWLTWGFLFPTAFVVKSMRILKDQAVCFPSWKVELIKML